MYILVGIIALVVAGVYVKYGSMNYVFKNPMDYYRNSDIDKARKIQ